MSTDNRLQQLHDWLNKCLLMTDYHLQPASVDASFRRYFRLSHNDVSYIVMDAPPEKEDSRPFFDISKVLIDLGLNAPEVIEWAQDQGFLLLTDLGKQQYLEILNADTVEKLYGDAMGALLILQACGDTQHSFPSYDVDLLMSEMALFRDWLLVKHLGIQLRSADQAMLEKTFSLLAESALEQPQVLVHRDFHSRNLMFVDAHNPGILDFQDAVIGPVTYDLVSLLRDCYIEWPRKQVEAWVRNYHGRALQSGILREDNEKLFLRWFDLMGVQRHLKAAGIFARLNYRDNKPAYLEDVPRTLGYIIEVSGRYPELEGLHGFLLETVSI